MAFLVALSRILASQSEDGITPAEAAEARPKFAFHGRLDTLPLTLS
jgi:hypothetical protein